MSKHVYHIPGTSAAAAGCLMGATQLTTYSYFEQCTPVRLPAGGVVAHQTTVVIDGNAAFVNNSADHDGGERTCMGIMAIHNTYTTSMN